MIIGTRGSELARTQTNTVVQQLSKQLACEIEVSIIVTQGDRVTDRPLRELEGRGYFTKELEQALLDGQIDIAVHSYKDMPSKQPEGLMIAAVSKREDPADILIIRREHFDNNFATIPVAAETLIGTSAVRRESQIKALRPDVVTADLRGNVPTRIQKLRDGKYGAIVLAAAGVNRLAIDLSEFVVRRLDPREFIPSPGQGALAVQMRSSDSRAAQVRSILHDEDAAIATTIERAVQARFGGGCGLPLGAHAFRTDSGWRLDGFYGAAGEPYARASVEGSDGSGLADELFAKLQIRTAAPCEC